MNYIPLFLISMLWSTVFCMEIGDTELQDIADIKEKYIYTSGRLAFLEPNGKIFQAFIPQVRVTVDQNCPYNKKSFKTLLKEKKKQDCTLILSTTFKPDYSRNTIPPCITYTTQEASPIFQKQAKTHDTDGYVRKRNDGVLLTSFSSILHAPEISNSANSLHVQGIGSDAEWERLASHLFLSANNPLYSIKDRLPAVKQVTNMYHRNLQSGCKSRHWYYFAKQYATILGLHTKYTWEKKDAEKLIDELEKFKQLPPPVKSERSSAEFPPENVTLDFSSQNHVLSVPVLITQDAKSNNTAIFSPSFEINLSEKEFCTQSSWNDLIQKYAAYNLPLLIGITHSFVLDYTKHHSTALHIEPFDFIELLSKNNLDFSSLLGLKNLCVLKNPRTYSPAAFIRICAVCDNNKVIDWDCLPSHCDAAADYALPGYLSLRGKSAFYKDYYENPATALAVACMLPPSSYWFDFSKNNRERAQTTCQRAMYHKISSSIVSNNSYHVLAAMLARKVAQQTHFPEWAQEAKDFLEKHSSLDKK